MITEPVQLPLPFLPGLLAHHRAVLVDLASGAWQRRAACRDGRLDDWFPEDDQDGSAAFEARRVCGGCPVARQCLSWALLAGEQGIWGGTTDTERDAILADLGSGLPLRPRPGNRSAGGVTMITETTATITELADARNLEIAGKTPSVQGLTDLAVKHGVCVRPVLQRLIDTTTGETRIVPIPCGTTRADRCPPCADRNRKLRMTQCREGWHLEDEPVTDDHDTTEDDEDEDDADPADDIGDGDDDQDQDRRVRSTRRRQDVPDLPKGDRRDGTVARQLTSPNGNRYRPSMFFTVTLGSYGPVHAESGRCRCGEHHRPGSALAGTPLFPHRYDYRRAALDVLHFGKLVDRLWKNLRRVAGFEMQYFATVEPQRRGAMHLHVATRGAMTGTLLRQVVAATYHQLWWPPHDTPVYTDPARMPIWNADRQAFVDRVTRRPLPTWDEALDALDADPAARPAHVTRFGPQVDHKWLIGGSERTERVIGYLCKYVTKSVSETLSEPPRRVRRLSSLRLRRLLGSGGERSERLLPRLV